MGQELIKKTMELFESPEKWNAFLELDNLKDSIIQEWFNKLNYEVVLKIKLNSEWDVKCNREGVQWFLKKFDKTSLSIWLESEKFSLWANAYYYDTDFISRKIKEEKFNAINNCILHKDIEFQSDYIFGEIGRFEFNSIHDNNFNKLHLAWFAGNQTDDFITQIQKKLDPFFEKETTELLLELNSISKKNT